jgi:hypothetical protein
VWMMLRILRLPYQVSRASLSDASIMLPAS